MVLAFATFIVAPCATQDMSKLETRFEQAENFGISGSFFLSAGLSLAGVYPRLPGPHRGWKGLLWSSSPHCGGELFLPSFRCCSSRKKKSSENAKKSRNPHDSWTFLMELVSGLEPLTC